MCDMRSWMQLFNELYESSLDILKAAQGLAQKYGVKVDLSAEGPREIQLIWIERTTGAKGNGGQFLADLIRLCDQQGVTIMLTVMDGHPKLIAFYGRAGFKLIDPGGDGEDPVMERTPRA